MEFYKSISNVKKGPILVLWILVLLNPWSKHLVIAYPDGAPNHVCDTMQPSLQFHGPSIVGKDQKFPYKIVASTSKIKPKQGLAIKINGTIAYKGILLEAIHFPTGKKIGTFINPRPGTAILKCTDGSIAITHDGTKLSLLNTQYFWRAPDIYIPGTVVF
ncbi:unnamed protein product [Gordionus sp. m RMFG-2023]